MMESANNKFYYTVSFTSVSIYALPAVKEVREINRKSKKLINS